MPDVKTGIPEQKKRELALEGHNGFWILVRTVP